VSTHRRTTQQQVAISRTLERTERPLTVPEIHGQALETCDRLGVATVYRTVNRLVEEGWLTEVSLPGEPARYELRDLAHHHHFRCERCERVFDVAAPCGSITTSIPKGFRVFRHELTFHGLCVECDAASG
jgi:Fur family ferric uptake transcriptional regulator